MLPEFSGENEKKTQNICGQKGFRIEYTRGYTSAKYQLKQLN
jgi:hypothetical protein